MLEAFAQKVDSSAVRHPNGEKVSVSFADSYRPLSKGTTIHTQRWLVQTSLPHKQTSLQLSGLVCGYKVCSGHIMQTGLSQ